MVSDCMSPGEDQKRKLKKSLNGTLVKSVPDGHRVAFLLYHLLIKLPGSLIDAAFVLSSTYFLFT